MILVTGAGGKTGEAVVQALLARDTPVRALVRQSAGGKFDRHADVEPHTGDLLDSDAMGRVMTGVRAVYLIAPNVHPEESRIGAIAIAAARQAGVERIVYHSVLHPQTREMPHHWRKLDVEERLFASGLRYTLLQPCAYMQNVLAFRQEIVEKGTYRVPYGNGAAISMVDLADVAEVAARVLTETTHDGATYELAGPEPLNPTSIAGILSKRLGRPIRAERQSLDEWAADARSRGLDEDSLDALARMFRYYDRHGLKGNPHVLECLLGRPATAFSEFVATPGIF